MTQLFVAATEAEARYLPASASVLVTGIGKVAAATALTRRLASYGAAGLASLEIVLLMASSLPSDAQVGAEQIDEHATRHSREA